MAGAENETSSTGGTQRHRAGENVERYHAKPRADPALVVEAARAIEGLR